MFKSKELKFECAVCIRVIIIDIAILYDDNNPNLKMHAQCVKYFPSGYFFKFKFAFIQWVFISYFIFT